MACKALANFSPGRTILLSILGMIIIGTLLLALPSARTMPMPWIDLLFTATSATCVTGLLTAPLDHFSIFGQFIILILIQIGGLGIITMSLFFISLFVDLGLTRQLMAGQLLELNSWSHVKKIVGLTIAITLITECVGALLIYGALYAASSESPSFFYAVFHAISSFCNVGISLLPPHLIQGSMVLLTTIFLMIIGGIGFITWYEIFTYMVGRFQEKRYHCFSLHSKIVLYGSVTIIGVAVLIFWFLERDNLLRGAGHFESGVHSLFNIVSFRGSGFLLTSIHNLRHPTKILALIISFIGSSPLSTGSGVKITTFVIFIFLIKSALAGKTSVEIKGRSIAIDQTYRAIAIITLSIIWIIISTFILIMTEKQTSFFNLFFEAVSAFTNLGLSTGVSEQLSSLGKSLIVINMIIGRIGSVGFILALRSKPSPPPREFSYPEERVMLG